MVSASPRTRSSTCRRCPPRAAALSLGSYAHARGWPVPIGGSQAIVDALAADLIAHGGRIETGREIRSLGDLTPAKAVLFDTSVPGMLRIAGKQIPTPKRGTLRRFRFGNAAAKVDFALSDPVPWTNAELRKAGTVHIGGTRSEIAAAEHAVAQGRHADRPYVLGSEPPWSTRSGAARQARLLGVRARARGIGRRPDRGGGAAGRAVRAGVPRHDPAVRQPDRRADGRVQPETTSAGTSPPAPRASGSS